MFLCVFLKAPDFYNNKEYLLRTLGEAIKIRNLVYAKCLNCQQR